MSKMQRLMILALAATVAVGGTSAFARGKKHLDSQPAVTNAVAVTSSEQAVGKKHHPRHPHGIVTAVSAGSITIEKVKKHKTKTFKVAANVAVEKKHGRKHGHKPQDAAGVTSGKKHGQHAQGGAKGQLSEVKVGDHVKLSLEGKQVVKIEDKGAKHHKHGKGTQAGASASPTV